MFKNRASWLDQFVYAFQHRWETNPQYRAAVSGFVGLALVITMCACTGVVSAATNAALAGIGLGGSGINSTGNLGTGTNRVKGAKSFPTPTVVLAPGAGGGVSQVANSQTPVPPPTAIPTATKDTSGGNGGQNNPPGVVTTCNGAQGTASWALDPCPQVHGQSGTLTIQAGRKYAGAATNVVIDFCAASSCALVFSPQGGYHLDSNGMETISFTVPDQAANSTTPINGMINIYPISGGSITMSILAAPVQ